MPQHLDLDKPIPYYYQIKEQILRDIQGGALAPGDRLPTEHWYCNYYGVSRITVRRAMDELAAAGVIERPRGHRAFVVQPKMQRALGPLTGIREVLREQGFETATKTLSAEKVAAGPDVAQALEVPGGTEVLLLVRLRSIGEAPLVLQKAYLPPWVTERVWTSWPEEQSIYGVFERHGIQVKRAEQKLSAVMPDKWQREVLQIGADEPLMYVERTAYTEDGKPAEHSMAWQIASKVELTMTLQK